jgi:hypothetical protein
MQYPLHRGLRGPDGRSERVRKISPSPGFDPGTVQPVSSRYIQMFPVSNFTNCYVRAGRLTGSSQANGVVFRRVRKIAKSDY